MCIRDRDNAVESINSDISFSQKIKKAVQITNIKTNIFMLSFSLFVTSVQSSTFGENIQIIQKEKIAKG